MTHCMHASDYFRMELQSILCSFRLQKVQHAKYGLFPDPEHLANLLMARTSEALTTSADLEMWSE